MHQNIPLRGHRDRAKSDPEIIKSDLTNSGMFVELLHHKVKGWYRNLDRNHLQNA